MLLYPAEIIPMDSINKIALRYNLGLYEAFAEKVEQFKNENHKKIQELVNMLSPRAKKIESIFSNELKNLEKIRVNRAVDKLLLAIGRNR